MAKSEADKTISELLGNLTLKEHRFADAWLRNGGKGTEAIFTAGYDCKDENSAASMAHTMLQKPHIAEYIARALYPEVTELTPEWVKQQLAYEAATANHAGARVRCLELLGKTHGIFVEKHEVEHFHTSDAELIRSAAQDSPLVAAAILNMLAGDKGTTDEVLDDAFGDDPEKRAEIQAALVQVQKSGAALH